MKRVGPLVVLCAALAACGGSGAHYERDQLRDLVLQPKDVTAYSQFAFGEQVHADAHPGPRADEGRFDRVGGWIARYRRTGGTLETKGALVVESRADLFGSSSHAERDLDAYGEEYEALAASAGGGRLDAPRVGDEAVAFAYGSASDRFFLVAWRRGNATASVVVEGARVALADAIALAKKQDARFD